MKQKNYTFLVIFDILIILFIPIWLIQLLAFTILLILALGYLYARILSIYLQAYHIEEKIRIHPYLGTTIKFIIENRSFLPIHGILVKDNLGELDAEAKPLFFFSLKAWQKKTCSYQITGSKRGLYKVGPLQVTYTDPFGLFSWTNKMDAFMEVVVYPRVLPLNLINDRGLPAGDIPSKNITHEDLTRYRSMKEYTPGDDTRRINWKISAKQRSLYCMEYLPTLYFPTLVALNLTTDDYPVKSRYNLLERAIETAASLIYYIVGLNQQIGFITTGITAEDPAPRYIPLKSGYEQAVTLLELLAVLQPGAQQLAPLLFETALNLPYNSRMLIVSPRITEIELNFLYNAWQKGYMVELFHIAPTKDEISREKNLEQPGLYFHYVKDYGTEVI